MTPTDFPQTFSFSAARLAAPSLLALLGDLAECRLVVAADGRAVLTGTGYREDAAYAFTRLIYDWEARTELTYDPSLPPGTYSLGWREDVPVVYVAGAAVSLPDGPVEVVLRQVAEEE